MSKFKRLIFAALFAAAPALFAQSYTTVQATQVKNAFGGGLAAGQLCFVSNVPLTPSGGAASTSYCGAVTSGALTGSLQVPNLATATPSGASYTIQVVDFSNATPTSVVWIPNVYSVTGPSFSFDSFNVPAGILVTGYDTPRIACQSGASYIQANAPNGSNRWSCIGGQWSQNSSGSAQPKGIFSLNGLTSTSQMFVNDANIGISSLSGTHAITWTGQLAKSRQHAATAYLDGANTFTGASLDASAVTVTKPFSVLQGVPSGACSNAAAFATNGLAANANIYECVSGNWQQLISSGSGGGGNCATCTTSNYSLGNTQLVSGDGTGLGIKPIDLTGDVTTSGTNTARLQAVNSNPGTFGDATHSLQITVDQKGRVTSLSTNLISASSGTVTNSTGALTANRLIGGNGTNDVKGVDLSGDVSTSGGLATTLSTINASPGSYGDATHTPQLTVDSKGRITSVAQVLSSGGGGGSGITALTGDVTASGTGSVAATLATVNSSTGTYGDSTHTPRFTVDGKGRITAVSSVVSAGGGGGAGTSTAIQSGTLSLIPATCASGDVYWATDASIGQMFYTCTSANNWNALGVLGGSGALAYNGTTGALDIVTSVVPRLSAANTFAGSNTFGGTQTFNNIVVNGTCTGTGCAGGGGSSYNQTVQVNGTPVTQRAKLNLAAGTGATLTATDNGTDTTTVTIASTGGGGGTTVAANGPYLDIAGTHYIASHMVVPTLWTNSGYTTAMGSAPTYSASTLAPTLTFSGATGGIAYVKNLSSASVLHVGATCSLDGGDNGCGLVVLTSSNEGQACWFKNIGVQGSNFVCEHIVGGVLDTGQGLNAQVNSLPYSVSDLWIGVEGANVSGSGTPKFVLSGDGGRTWNQMAQFNFNLGSNPTKAGIFLVGTGTMQVLSLDQH